MQPFWKHAILMFVALRAGDAVNLAAGLWLVPKFVAPADLGAVLPLTTVATLFVLPAFAFGMAVMKESADLAGRNRRGQLKSLWRGVFVAIAALTVLSLAVSALLLPRYLHRVLGTTAERRPATAFLVIAAAMLGSVAPVYTDALQAVKRFGTLGVLEFSAALVRLATLLLVMPFRALAGYFAGGALQPLVRIVGSVIALRRELAAPAECWWTREHTRTLFTRFALVLLYLAAPMAVSGVEQDLVRHALPATDSAAYFIVTRLSDLMNYLTFPLLIVLFPYAADAERNGRSTFSLVAKTSLVTLIAAVLLGVVYAHFGKSLLALIPNGANYSDHLVHLPTLLAITALTACQTFYTNAEVAAGRFCFLWWFIPVNAAYALFLIHPNFPNHTNLPNLLNLFMTGALLRFASAAIAALAGRHPRRILPDDVRGNGSDRTFTTEMRL